MAQAALKAALSAGAALRGAGQAARATPQLLRPAAALLPRLAARRPLATAAAAADPADPYWADADKPKVNVYSAYTIYKVGGGSCGSCRAAADLAAASPAAPRTSNLQLRPPPVAAASSVHHAALLLPHAQGSAAMALKVIKPTWHQIGSGLAIEREGTVLLEFAKSTGPRSYAWEQKEVRQWRLQAGAAARAAGQRRLAFAQGHACHLGPLPCACGCCHSFAAADWCLPLLPSPPANSRQPQTFGLSAVECAAVLEAADRHQPANFVHDPYKGGEGEGRIIKTLRWAAQGRQQAWLHGCRQPVLGCQRAVGPQRAA